MELKSVAFVNKMVGKVCYANERVAYVAKESAAGKVADKDVVKVYRNVMAVTACVEYRLQPLFQCRPRKFDYVNAV